MLYSIRQYRLNRTSEDRILRQICAGIVMVLLCCRERFWIFRARACDRLYNSIARKSTENGPTGRNWMGNLVDRMRLRSNVAQMKFKVSLLSPILWDMLRYSCARYLDFATKARRYWFRYFTFTLKMRIHRQADFDTFELIESYKNVWSI